MPWRIRSQQDLPTSLILQERNGRGRPHLPKVAGCWGLCFLTCCCQGTQTGARLCFPPYFHYLKELLGFLAQWDPPILFELCCDSKVEGGFTNKSLSNFTLFFSMYILKPGQFKVKLPLCSLTYCHATLQFNFLSGFVTHQSLMLSVDKDLVMISLF